MLNPDFKKNLLRLLAENARRPLEDIADRLETTPEKVASAITELEEANEIVGYCALIDESVLPEAAVKAIIEIKIRPEREGGFDRIARRLSKYPQVTSLYLMSGGFDLMAEVRGATLNDVAMFVSSKLATIDGVLSTATHFLLKKYKESGKLYEEEETNERLQVTP
ncbi:MAG: Lrp/AsnC family transcriptional regulator [Lentisphaeria bacterium]|nr:Lrp/AsnC family transcriptional regulator [Lentisphaeria bacterium]MBR1999948.1 Lrp/AsnC family transcriptional regulator [Lentisphaeria bacterium]